MLTFDAAIAANRFGLGARPGEARAIGADATGLAVRAARAAGCASRRCPARAATPEVGTRAEREVREPTARRRRHEFGSFVREHYVAQTAERHRLALARGAPVRRAARALLEQPLRRVGRQAAARCARGTVRAGSDPAARDGQFLRLAARGRAPPRDDSVSRQSSVDGRELAGRERSCAATAVASSA